METSPALVDTDVVSWLALGESRSAAFAPLLAGRKLFVSFVTIAEIKTLLAMSVLEAEFCELLTKSLEKYAVLPIDTDPLISSWVKLRSATVRHTNADDRERRQNDT